MTVFLTSSPTGPLDNSRHVEGFDAKNHLIDNLKACWKEGSRCLLISAAPAHPGFNDMVQGDMIHALQHNDFSFSHFETWDDRTTDFSREALHSFDAIFLGGGHVPTQNEFFHRIHLRETIRDFPGIILGISAGTMNSSDVVYAQPELPGEAVDPHYTRFLSGLGLIQENILPHYQMTKDFHLDGMRLFEDITYPDSFGKIFLALPDGSYLQIKDGIKEIWGEAYQIKDGHLANLLGWSADLSELTFLCMSLFSNG